jgi:hypothetical protein
LNLTDEKAGDHARGLAPVDGVGGARDVPRLIQAEEGDEVADFLCVRDALERRLVGDALVKRVHVA